SPGKIFTKITTAQKSAQAAQGPEGTGVIAIEVPSSVTAAEMKQISGDLIRTEGHSVSGVIFVQGGEPVAYEGTATALAPRSANGPTEGLGGGILAGIGGVIILADTIARLHNRQRCEQSGRVYQDERTGALG